MSEVNARRPAVKQIWVIEYRTINPHHEDAPWFVSLSEPPHLKRPSQRLNSLNRDGLIRYTFEYRAVAYVPVEASRD